MDLVEPIFGCYITISCQEKNTDQKIIIFEFSENNVLSKKMILSKEDINSIDHEITVTDSSGKKLSWYKEFFKNLNPDPFGAGR